MSFIQQFFTSRDNNANAQTFVGQEGRLWFDPVTNQMYSSNGNTPGGIPLSGGGGNGVSIVPNDVTYGTGSLYGNANPGFTVVTISEDDEAYSIPVDFPIEFLGNSYSAGNVFLVSNSYLTFGPDDYTDYQPVGPGVIPVPAIFLGAMDLSNQKYYYGYADGTDVFVIGYEGSINTSGQEDYPAIQWELQVSSATPDQITIVVDGPAGGGALNFPAGVWGISNGAVWIDQFQPLPWYSNNNGDTYNAITIAPVIPVAVSTIAFTGPGVTYSANGNTTFINIDPFDQVISVGFSQGDAIISSVYGELTITTASNADNLNLRPLGDVNIEGGNRSNNQPGDGYRVTISGGNAHDDPIIPGQNYNGGDIRIKGGSAVGNSPPGDVWITSNNNTWQFMPTGEFTIPGNITVTNTFKVAPVRNDVANTDQVMFYNTTSNEITYGNVISVAGNVTGGNLSTAGNLVLSNVNINSNTNAIQGWSYANVALSITAAESTPAGLFFGNAGSSFYVVGTTNDRVLQYNMSSTNMANTGVLFGNVIVSGQDTAPNDLFINSTGANMYVLGQTNRVVYQYTIPTPWNITTATYSTLSANVAAQDTAPTGLWFKPDLTTMYMVGSTNNTVYQYTLSTPGNIATATYASKSFNVTAGGAGGGGTGAVNLSSDGAKMWTIASSVPSIAEYNLATPWDVSTASYVLGNSVGILAQESTPTGMFVDLANSRAWMIGSSNDTVYQFNTANSIIQTANAVGIRGQLAVQGNAWFAQQVQLGNAVRAENTFTVDSTFSAGSTVVMSTTTGTIGIGTFQTTGNTLIGNATQTGSLALGQSTATQTVNIANGAVSSGNTKTVSLATGGVANSVSAVTIFSGVAGNSTLTIGASTGNTTVSYTANSIVAIANTSGTALSVTGNITGGNILTGGILRTTAIVVASLPTAAGAAAGARSFVTDATAATFGTIVAGGGANAVPVWSDGTNWKIG